MHLQPVILRAVGVLASQTDPSHILMYAPRAQFASRLPTTRII